jgi:hypothetical protein
MRRRQAPGPAPAGTVNSTGDIYNTNTTKNVVIGQTTSAGSMPLQVGGANAGIALQDRGRTDSHWNTFVLGNSYWVVAFR